MTARRVDFWKFWLGQTISQVGSSFTGFALPLLVYTLTGSAVNLAITTAAYFLPYLLFGLVIGAWVDRIDRERMMIGVDLGRALVLATIPILAYADALTVWWIYIGASLIAASFWFTALGHAEDYLPEPNPDAAARATRQE